MRRQRLRTTFDLRRRAINKKKNKKKTEGKEEARGIGGDQKKTRERQWSKSSRLRWRRTTEVEGVWITASLCACVFEWQLAKQCLPQKWELSNMLRMTGLTGIKRERPQRQRRCICVNQWCVFYPRARVSAGGFRAVLQRTSGASLPVFEDGIKACDEKVRNVRNAANRKNENKNFILEYNWYWFIWMVKFLHVDFFFFFPSPTWALFFFSFFFLPHRRLLHDLRWISVKTGSSLKLGGL